jgi:glycosyltransferase involved in cell wall biosynthesis
VEITGFVDSVEPYIRSAAVVGAPIRTGGGMRVKVAQAMAMGKAIVATPLAAEGIEAHGASMPLVLASSAEDFAAATALLLASADARKILGIQAREFAMTHLSWSKFGDRLEGIYAELRPPSRCLA